MIWRILLEVAVFVFVPLFVVTQMIAPAWRGRPMFPLFRKKPVVLDRLDAAKSSIADAELDLRVRAVEREAEKIRKKASS